VKNGSVEYSEGTLLIRSKRMIKVSLQREKEEFRNE